MMTRSLCLNGGAGLALLAALGLSGGSAEAAARHPTSTPRPANAVRSARPEALAQAEREIKNGQIARAQTRLEGWLAHAPHHPYRPEALYLLGQAQFAQGDYAAAKKSHNEVLDTTGDRTLKALAHLGRADCNFELKRYRVASRQYHWLEHVYRGVSAIPQDELFFKLGLCAKFSGFPETADYWFNRVVELYDTGPYAEEARRLHTKLGPGRNGAPTYYSLDVAAFGDKKKALAEAAVYRAKHYRNVRVVKYRAFGNTYYSVRIGKYDNENSAKRAKEDAELAGLSAAIRPGLIHTPR